MPRQERSSSPTFITDASDFARKGNAAFFAVAGGVYEAPLKPVIKAFLRSEYRVGPTMDCTVERGGAVSAISCGHQRGQGVVKIFDRAGGDLVKCFRVKAASAEVKGEAGLDCVAEKYTAAVVAGSDMSVALVDGRKRLGDVVQTMPSTIRADDLACVKVWNPLNASDGSGLVKADAARKVQLFDIRTQAPVMTMNESGRGDIMTLVTHGQRRVAVMVDGKLSIRDLAYAPSSQTFSCAGSARLGSVIDTVPAGADRLFGDVDKALLRVPGETGDDLRMFHMPSKGYVNLHLGRSSKVVRAHIARVGSREYVVAVCNQGNQDAGTSTTLKVYCMRDLMAEIVYRGPAASVRPVRQHVITCDARVHAIDEDAIWFVADGVNELCKFELTPENMRAVVSNA